MGRTVIDTRLIALGAALALGAGCTTEPTSLALSNARAQPLTVTYRVAGGEQHTAMLPPGSVMRVPDAHRMTDLTDLRWGDPGALNSFHDLPAAAQQSSCTSGCVVTFDTRRIRFTS